MSVNSVSSSTLSSVLQNSVSRLQSQLTTVETESSTGQLADVGLTLGADSAQEAALHQQMADLSAIASSNAVVTSQLDTESNAVSSLQSSASTLLASFVQGQSATPGGGAAAALQQQASGALQSFSALANASVGGVYVFGGINSGAAPVAAYADAEHAQTTQGIRQHFIRRRFQFIGFLINQQFQFHANTSPIARLTNTWHIARR